jgi:putative flippase GtrA
VTGTASLKAWVYHAARNPVRVVRFMLVGGVNTLVDVATFGALWALHRPNHDPWLAVAYSLAGWGAGSITGYVLHSRVTFRGSLPAGPFYAVSGLGVGVQTASTGLFTKLGGSRGALVGKVIGIFLGSSLTYVGYHVVAYLGRRRDLARPPATSDASS